MQSLWSITNKKKIGRRHEDRHWPSLSKVGRKIQVQKHYWVQQFCFSLLKCPFLEIVLYRFMWILNFFILMIVPILISISKNALGYLEDKCNQLFHDGGPRANQWTGFYMIGNSVVRELIKVMNKTLHEPIN